MVGWDVRCVTRLCPDFDSGGRGLDVLRKFYTVDHRCECNYQPPGLAPFFVMNELCSYSRNETAHIVL